MQHNFQEDREITRSKVFTSTNCKNFCRAKQDSFYVCGVFRVYKLSRLLFLFLFGCSVLLLLYGIIFAESLLIAAKVFSLTKYNISRHICKTFIS